MESLALVAERASDGGAPIRKPRIGLFQPWSGSMDEGWTRWLLEQYDFDFAVLHPEDFRTPLTGRIDVVILADDVRIPVEGASGGGGRGARRDGAAEAACRRREPVGRGRQGRRACRPAGVRICPHGRRHPGVRRVRQGRRHAGLVLNSATRWAIQQFKLPVKNAVEGLKPDDFFLRGSIVEVRPTSRIR